MRRMYSEQELTKIVEEVFDAKLEAGDFNDSIADAVDDYLTEHPVDITALEGLDISVGSLTSTGAISGASASISGNASVGGNLPVTGNITGSSIVETMSGYSFDAQHATNIIDLTPIYAGVVKNGNKLTFVWFFKFTPKNSGYSNSYAGIFTIPSAVAAKLYPSVSDYLYYGVGIALKADLSYENLQYGIEKVGGGSQVGLVLRGLQNITQEVEYTLRVEATFLLSDNLAA